MGLLLKYFRLCWLLNATIKWPLNDDQISTLIFSVSIDSYTGFALFRRSTVPEFSIHIFYWALPHHLEITNTVLGCLASRYISNYIELVHYDDVIMDTIASLITSLTIVYSTVHWDADQRKHQSSASLAFVWGIPAQMASNAENVSIWWRHHVLNLKKKWLHGRGR